MSQAWEHDPSPTIIFMYAYSGTHPNTGRQWRFFQAINFNYIPRAMRKRFLKAWTREFERNRGNTKFTWLKVKAKFPYLEKALRRYFYSPSYYVRDLVEIMPQDAEREIVKSLYKDFSKKITTALLGKFKKALRARGKQKKKKKNKRK